LQEKCSFLCRDYGGLPADFGAQYSNPTIIYDRLASEYGELNRNFKVLSGNCSSPIASYAKLQDEYLELNQLYGCCNQTAQRWRRPTATLSSNVKRCLGYGMGPSDRLPRHHCRSL